jgi:hypothetical protein
MIFRDYDLGTWKTWKISKKRLLRSMSTDLIATTVTIMIIIMDRGA